MRLRSRIRLLACWPALLPVLASPAIAAGTSGAASMRVEVQVYKGPVGQNAAAQIGEMTEILAESARAMRNWLDLAQAFYHVETNAPKGNRRCGGGTVPSLDASDCRPLRNAIQSGEEIVAGLCGIFPGWIDEARYKDGNRNVEWSTACKGWQNPAGFPQSAGTNAFPPERPAEEPLLMGPADRNRDPGRFGRLEGNPVVLGAPLVGTRPSFQTIIANWQEFDRRIAGVAAGMKSKAFRVADANVAAVPRQRPVRTLLASFGFIASEYSNQIQSRLSVLAKQMLASERRCPVFLASLRDSQPKNSKPKEPAPAPSPAAKPADAEPLCGVVFDDPLRQRTLPMSDYLRDAGNTDFLHLYDWLNATMPGGAVGLSAAARTRMAERLTDDYYWEKVNEVYASGQGDVSMAFIKDELGNWNLKSFSNDPRALLDGYRKAAGAALKAVATLASGGTSVASGTAKLDLAQRAAGLAQQLSGGAVESPATVAGLDVTRLHTRAAARLAARQAAFETREAPLKAARDTAATKLANATSAVATAAPDAIDAAKQTEAAAAKGLADAEAALAALATDARTAATDILDDHLAVVAALQEGVAGTAPAIAAPPTTQP